jgi:hypothetical protein
MPFQVTRLVKHCLVLPGKRIAELVLNQIPIASSGPTTTGIIYISMDKDNQHLMIDISQHRSSNEDSAKEIFHKD